MSLALENPGKMTGSRFDFILARSVCVGNAPRVNGGVPGQRVSQRAHRHV